MYALFGALLGAVDSLAFLPNLAVCADCAPKERLLLKASSLSS